MCLTCDINSLQDPLDEKLSTYFDNDIASVCKLLDEVESKGNWPNLSGEKTSTFFMNYFRLLFFIF